MSSAHDVARDKVRCVGGVYEMLLCLGHGGVGGFCLSVCGLGQGLEGGMVLCQCVL